MFYSNLFKTLVSGLVILTLSVSNTNAQEDLKAIYNKAMDLMSAYQFEQAQELLSECYIQEPENMDYLNKIAYCNFQLGRYKDAQLFYGEVLKLDSINTIAISSLGSIAE